MEDLRPLLANLHEQRGRLITTMAQAPDNCTILEIQQLATLQGAITAVEAVIRDAERDADPKRSLVGLDDMD